VVITGGSGSIGTATAIGFARAGAAAIILTGRTEKTLKETAAAIKEVVSSVNVKYYVSDVTDEKTFTAAMDDVKKTLGPISIFIDNAGFLYKGPLMTQDPGFLADWWKELEVNVLGSLIAFRAFLPNAAPNATLINNTSGIGHLPAMPFISSYQVSKLANSKLMENISVEHPELFVLNVQPGVIDSTINRKSDIPGTDNANLPGNFAVWAASPEARFLNGKYIYCNWDVEELVSRKSNFEEPTFMKLGLEGNSAKGFSFGG
jgi:NAD(P)-dependent dehydrogenase (short-subunit alcohol dehydrogenase family)